MKLKIKRPVIIVGCPRSGTSMLFTILRESKELYSMYRESHDVIDKFYINKQKSFKTYKSDVLEEKDLDEESKKILLDSFHGSVVNNARLGHFITLYLRKTIFYNTFLYLNRLYKSITTPEYRIIEKTPRNSFRISFLNKLFPDAIFIYLNRDGRETISSIIEGWKKGPVRDDRYPDVYGSINIKVRNEKFLNTWNYVLPPDWEKYRDSNVEEIAAYQWIMANQYIRDGLKNIPKDRVYELNYEKLTENTEEEIQKLCEFIGIEYTDGIKKIAVKPPVVSATEKNEAPKKDKWKKNEDLINKILPKIEPMMKELGYSVDSNLTSVS